MAEAALRGPLGMGAPSEGVVVDVADCSGVAGLDVAKGVGVVEVEDDAIDDKLGRTAEVGKPVVAIGISLAM